MTIGEAKGLLKKSLFKAWPRSNYRFILKDWKSLDDLTAVSKVLETKRFSQNLDPSIVKVPEAKKALFIAPHPDDDIFSCGGTLVKLRQTGCYTKVIYLTSGSRDLSSSNNISSETEEEAKKVAANLGTDIEFWRYNTMGIKIDSESIERIRSVYRDFNPDIIFIPFLADDHDDHRRSSQLFYESFKGRKELNCDIWAYQTYSTIIPNVIIDITSEMDEKLRLAGMWESRMTRRDWPHYIKGLNAFNSRFMKTNEPRYVEVFFVVPAKEYMELCSIYFEHPNKNLYYTDFYKK